MTHPQGPINSSPRSKERHQTKPNQTTRASPRLQEQRTSRSPHPSTPGTRKPVLVRVEHHTSQLKMSSSGSSRSTSPSSDSEWSKKENKMFEEALAYYGVGAPNLWEKVATTMGGTKSAEQVRCHFQLLVDDVKNIEHGRIPFPKYKTQGFWT